MDLRFAGHRTADGQLAVFDGQVGGDALGHLPALYAGVGHAAGQRQTAAPAHLDAAPAGGIVGHQPRVFQHQGAASVADGGESGFGGGGFQTAVALQDHSHLVFAGSCNAVDHIIAHRGLDQHRTAGGNAGVDLFQRAGHRALHRDGSPLASDAQVSFRHIQLHIDQRQVSRRIDIVAGFAVAGGKRVAAALNDQRLGGQFGHAVRAGGASGFQFHVIQQHDGVAVRLAAFDGGKGFRHGGILAQTLHLNNRFGQGDRLAVRVGQRHIAAQRQAQAGIGQLGARKFGQPETAGCAAGHGQDRALGNAQFAIAGKRLNFGGFVHSQTAVVQRDGLGTGQLVGIDIRGVRLQVSAVQHKFGKAGHVRQDVIIVAAAHIHKGDGCPIAGAGQLHRPAVLPAAELSAGQCACKGQVAAADLGKAEAAAVHHGKGMIAGDHGGQRVIVRIDVGDVFDGQRRLQRQGIGQVHAGAGKVDDGGLVGRHIARPLDRCAAVVDGADLEGSCALRLVNGVDCIVQRGIAGHAAGAVGDDRLRALLSAE